jgi:hypothetical protein
MSDVARDGVIFLSVGFLGYLSWKDELKTYLAFATSGALPSFGSTIAAATAPEQSDLDAAQANPATTFAQQLGLYDAQSALYGGGN